MLLNATRLALSRQYGIDYFLSVCPVVGKGFSYRGANLGGGAVVAFGFGVPAGLAQGVGGVEDGLVLGRRQLSCANVLVGSFGVPVAFR